MNAVTDPTATEITVMKSARIGWTKILNHTIGYHVHQDPCSMLIVQPTLEDVKGYSKEELAPMLRDTPVLKGLVQDPRTRDSGNTTLNKLFPGGVIHLVGANSPRGFRRITTRINLFDELDGWPATTAEGDQELLARKRTETFWNRKELAGSTPTNKGTSRIERRFDRSDKRYYFIPCPLCNEFQVLKFENIKWEKDKPEGAWYECEYCHGRIEHHQKRGMVEKGEWRATAPFNGHAGFHIWAGYSYSPNAAWGVLAREFLEAKGDVERLRTFLNTALGETWDETGQKQIDSDEIYARREKYGPVLPLGIGILTASVDVQDDRLEVDVKGWGKVKESWGVELKVLRGNPAKPELWEQLDQYLGSSWLHDCGLQLRISCVAIDTGGHHTDRVYDFCKFRAERHIIAVKGASHPGKPIIASRPSKNNRANINLYLVGTDTAKNAIAARLKITEPGPGYMHFNETYDTEYFNQLTAEHLKTIKSKGGLVKVWVLQGSRRNEALDLTVYNWAALKYLEMFGNFNLEKIVDSLYEYKRGVVAPVVQKQKASRILYQGMQGGEWIK